MRADEEVGKELCPGQSSGTDIGVPLRAAVTEGKDTLPLSWPIGITGNLQQ